MLMNWDSSRNTRYRHTLILHTPDIRRLQAAGNKSRSEQKSVHEAWEGKHRVYTLATTDHDQRNPAGKGFRMQDHT